MSEYANEPIRGLPGHLPAGEHIVWQGAPEWRALAKSALHTHLVGGYFALLIAWSLLTVATGHRSLASALPGIAITLGVGVGAVVLLLGLGWLTARSTVYTLTNKRIVLRFGVALPKCVNLPYSQILSADLQINRDGTGDLPLACRQTRLGFIHLWPHVRPWRIGRPEPMLRNLGQPHRVAQMLAQALTDGAAPRTAPEPTAVQVFAPASRIAA